jgi:HSP20 family protein
MAEPATKLVVKNETKQPPTPEFRPFGNLRREIDRLFDDFAWGSSWRLPSPRSLFDVEPFWRGDITWGRVPAVDIADTDKATRSPQSCPGWTKRTSRSNSRAAC